ncbi:hypothetical protein [Methylorubrum populi]
MCKSVDRCAVRNRLANPVVRPHLISNAFIDDTKEASGVPAQKKPAAFGTALAKAALAAAARLVSALAPQPVLQPIPIRVKSTRRR